MGETTLVLTAALIGAVAALVGSIIGGWAQGRFAHYYETKRAATEKRERWTKAALEWATNGRVETLRRVDLTGADLRGVDLDSTGIDKPADMSYANLSYSDLTNANLRAADLTGANLARANLGWAKLQQADLSLADLSRANLGWANLQESTLRLANLSMANLREANLREADLSLAKLTGTDLTTANLRGTNLNKSRYTGRTKWPAKFDVKSVGAINTNSAIRKDLAPLIGARLVGLGALIFTLSLPTISYLALLILACAAPILVVVLTDEVRTRQEAYDAGFLTKSDAE